MFQKNISIKRYPRLSTKMSTWLTATIVMFAMFAGQVTNVQAEVKVTDYATNIDIQDDGSMKQTETFGFDVKGTENEINHRIDLGELGKLTDLAINMKSVSANAFFPFVASDSNEVGTYTLTERENGMDITIYNTITNAPHIAQISGTLSDLWTNYAEWSILKANFLALPYDTEQASLTLNFPAAVPADQSDIIVSSKAKTNLSWSEDRTSLTITAENLGANEVIGVQMYMPVALLANNQTVGKESEGESIIKEMQASRKAEANQQTRLTRQIWLVSGALFILIFAYAVYLFMKKRAIFNAVPDLKGAVQSKPNYFAPHSVAMLTGKKYSDTQAIVLLILEMIENKTLAAHFITNKRGQIADIQVTPLTNETNHPAGQLLLAAVVEQTDAQRQVVSLNELIFNPASKGVVLFTRLGRKLVRKIRQNAKQALNKEGVYSKMNQVFHTILTIYMVAWLFGTFFVGYWQVQLGQVNIWAIVLIILSLALVYLIQQNVLPLRTETGVALYRQWQSYLKQLVQQTTAGEVWSNQSNEWLDDKYLYSWVAANNVKLAKNVEKDPQILQLPLMGSAQSIAHLSLKRMKWQPEFVADQTDSEENKQ